MKVKTLLTALWVISTINLYAQFSGGSGTIENPYQIETLEQLQAIGDLENLNKHFLQITNIDATETSSWNDGHGFVPIGTSTFKFTGSFDGNNYTISNLNINRPSQDYVGLFGYAENATFRNINLFLAEIIGKNYCAGIVGYGNLYDFFFENINVSGSISGQLSVGGLAGYIDGGIIKNCLTNVNIAAGDYVAGGLIGGLYRGSITESFSNGNVNGGTNVGGFVGYLGSTSTINRSVATGNVVGTGEIVGGFIGTLDNAEISNSYSTGNVAADNTVGGFVGRNIEDSSISLSYSSCLVEGDSNVGGFVGLNASTIQSSYWDKESSNQISGVGYGYSSGFNGLTTEQMTNVNPYENMPEFEFGIIWQLTENYPVLDWEDVEVIFPHVPAEPILLSPPDGSENLTTENTYTWEPPIFSEYFTMQISTNIDFVEPEIEIIDLTVSEYTTNGLNWGTTYFWRVSASNSLGTGDWSEIWSFSTTEVTSVYEIELNNIKIWPNPVSNILYINSKNLSASNNLIISTVEGRVLINRRIERGTNHFDMSSFPNGVYILKLNSGNDSVNKKIIKH